jgi:hypothetical protein
MARMSLPVPAAELSLVDMTSLNFQDADGTASQSVPEPPTTANKVPEDTARKLADPQH